MQEMTTERFDLITFDCYGTLIDWESGIAGAFQLAAAQTGQSIDPHQIIKSYMAEELKVETEQYRSYRQVLDETARRVASVAGIDMSSVQPDFLSNSIGEWMPFADANPALKRLSKRFSLGILSNVDDDLLALTLRRLEARFDLIITAEQVRSYKPAHPHFVEARRRAGSKKQLHAAQSYFHDVVPSKQLEITVAWVNRKSEQPAAGGPSPDYEVTDLRELADLLEADKRV
jgi:2-haloalkanoic acid dehalogenase type II